MKKQKVKSNVLDNLVIAQPCALTWDVLEGEDSRKRACQACSRSIYNISDMNRAEVEEFLAENGMSHCMTFYRRNDGTIMTDECPRALRKIRDRFKLVSKVVAGFLALVCSHQAASAQDGNKRMMMGRPMAGSQDHQIVPVQSAPAASNVQPQTVTDPFAAQSDNSVPRPKQNINANLENAAYRYYELAQKAARIGQTKWAERDLQKALDAFDRQRTKGDPKFRCVIEAELKKVRAAKPKSKTKSKSKSKSK